MSRKKKTPPFIIEMIKRHSEHIEWIEESIATKSHVPVEFQAEHVRNATVDHLIGRIIGMNSMLEDALHAYGCYNGFSYRARPTIIDGVKIQEWVGLNDPRFAEYRRVYNAH